MKLSKKIIINHILNTILLIVCASFFMGCKHTDKNDPYKTDNDTIYMYFQNQNSTIKQKKWQLNDSTSYIMNFNVRGRLKSEGTVLYDNLKIGKWNYFKKRSGENLKEIREYKIINGKEYLNQDWVINDKNDTVDGHFISHNPLKDEYIYGDTMEVQFYYPIPLMSKNSELYLVYAKEGEFNSTFSNISSLTLDTLPNIYRINKLKDNIQSQYKRSVYRNYILKSKGKKHLRHIFLERFDTIYNDTLSTSFIEIYFEKEIYVKDTIN